MSTAMKTAQSEAWQAIPRDLAELLETLSLLDDRGARIDLLIGIADRFQDVPETIARRPFSEQHKVPACESEAYVWAQRQTDGTLRFHFAIENPQGISAKALAVLLADTLSGAPLEQVIALDSSLVYGVFGQELSMGKSMGLMAMVSMVQSSAQKALEQQRSAPPGEPEHP